MTETNSVSSGWGSDLRAAAVGAMAPFLCGLLVLIGYVWLAGFGILVGLGAAIFWAVWWYRRNDRAFFPRDINGGAFAITIGLTAGAFILTLVLT